ncbi:NAD(+)/NADH kinase [Conexibacter sp. SYSU D00693]|uniref:NAD(+)/NADH kinase n=1 Tax=Conexibacter sp. SYSU D00693 TaxID=2812560 RepID=UPI00196A1F32|nr:NAD(+)/NADH kinase [Conexibacter sp. SYSU D00693]
MRSATVLTHQRPEQVAGVLGDLCRAAVRSQVRLRFDEEEAAKHDLSAYEGFEVGPMRDDVDLCLVLGGDGTILRALRRYAGTGVPVFGVNFGEVGFLATIDPDGVQEDLERALEGDFEVLTLPALAVETGDGRELAAINDISLHRRVGERVAQLAYGVGDEEVGSVRCDGLVVSTPAGSTGYNLANGGPVMAWGVEGYAVSFIAPHSLTARALVVAPDDELTIFNRGREEVDVTVDGRPAGTIGPDGSITVRFVREAADLAQVPGSSFYRRLRQKFGRLAA